MSIAALMQQMSDAGAPMEAILIAVRAIEAKEMEIADRRAKAADRKRSERLRKRMSRDGHATVEGRSQRHIPNEDTSNLSSSSPTGSEERPTTARAGCAFVKPEWADAGHWRDFMANRKRRRMTNSPTAYASFLADVARLADDEWPPGRLLELAAGKGWGSINRPDQDHRNGRPNTNGMGGNRGEARIVGAGRRFVARGNPAH